MCINKSELNCYKSLNKITHQNSAVLFGSTFAKEIPVSELRQNFGIVSHIYNRSLTDLSVFEASDIAKDIIDEINPSKILLQLGETDLASGKVSSDEVISEISNVVNTLRNANRKTKIVLISINNLLDKNLQSEFNKKLESLANNNKCIYADIGKENKEDALHINAFKSLSYFFTDEITAQLF